MSNKELLKLAKYVQKKLNSLKKQFKKDYEIDLNENTYYIEI